jgi:hypothetical protein
MSGADTWRPPWWPLAVLVALVTAVLILLALLTR